MIDRTRLARFLTVGVGAATLLFAVTLLLSSLGMPPFLASTVAYAIAFAVAYTAQRWWTFGARHDHRQALPRYLAVQVGCAVASGLSAQTAVQVFGAAPLSMAAVTTIVASAASYLLTSYWVFPEHFSVKPH